MIRNIFLADNEFAISLREECKEITNYAIRHEYRLPGTSCESVTTEQPDQAPADANPFPADVNALHGIILNKYLDIVGERNGDARSIDTVSRYAGDVAAWMLAEKRKPGLMIVGDVGTGKTTLMKAVVRTFADYKKRAEMLSACDIRDYAVNRDTAGEYGRLKKYVPILAIDDLGTEGATFKDYGNALHPMAELIAARYDNNAPTFITTNLTMTDISEQYGKRMRDRLAEMCHVVRFEDAPSFRV